MYSSTLCRVVSRERSKEFKTTGSTVSPPSQEFVLAEVHPLNDVPAVVEHPADVFRVHGAGEVWVAVVPAVPARRAYPLRGTNKGQQLPRSTSRVSAAYTLG